MLPIPERPLAELLAGRSCPVTVTVVPHVDGMAPVDEVVALIALLAVESPKVVLEIGTYLGQTTRLLAENMPQAQIHTVDLPPDYTTGNDPVTHLPKDDFHLIAVRRVGVEFAGQACADRITQHFADTATWNFAEAGPATCFFIDGAHTYEYCLNDSEKCFALGGGRGVFLWHDCDAHHDGVVRMLAEWRALGRDIVRVQGTTLAYWKAD